MPGRPLLLLVPALAIAGCAESTTPLDAAARDAPVAMDAPAECIDEDGDGFGSGAGCADPDCDDADPLIHPGASERCDGADGDCDGAIDERASDCAAASCAIAADGTSEATAAARCVAGSCTSEVASCGLFACDADACASSCAPGGTDDDARCAAAAHCVGGVCVADEADGETCDADGDCASGHCDDAICCDSGDCCAVAADCPSIGGIGAVCGSPSTCQGTRGEIVCEASACRTRSGVDDDSACDAAVRALDCDPYPAIFCTGEADQPVAACATSCASDVECAAGAHCEAAACVPDRAAGGACAREGECASGLMCADGVCCASACTGACESCAVAGMLGTCAAVPSGGDPDGECGAIACGAFFAGFDTDGRCARYGDASDSACDGARACFDAASVCPMQGRGAVQIDCDADCQAPEAGTCTGMTPGRCVDLDDPTDQLTCGTGACERSVQRCVLGALQTCMAGAPGTETCNGVDDDCNGAVDDGTTGGLCPSGGVCVVGGCLVARSCSELHGMAPALPSGAYDLDPDGPGGRTPMRVYCDMTSDGGGWTYGTIVTTSTDTAGRSRLAGVTTFGAAGDSASASEYSVDLLGITFSEVRIDNFTAARFVVRSTAAPVTWDATTYSSGFGFPAKRIAMSGGWEFRVGYYSDYCALPDVNLSMCFAGPGVPVAWVCDSDSMPIEGWLDNTGGELCTGPPGNYCRKWWTDGACISYSTMTARYGFAVR